MIFKTILGVLLLTIFYFITTLFIASIGTVADIMRHQNDFVYFEQLNDAVEKSKQDTTIKTNEAKVGIEYKVFYNNDKLGIRIDGYDIGSQVKLCDYKETICKELTVVQRANQKGQASIPRQVFSEFGNILHQGSVMLYIYE